MSRHKATGRPSNNRISDGVRDYALALVRERYADFGPTLATEKLGERDGLHVSRETVRGWMVDAGLWLSRKQRRTFHQPRLRREAYGELVQIDGSEPVAEGPVIMGSCGRYKEVKYTGCFSKGQPGAQFGLDSLQFGCCSPIQQCIEA